MANPRPNQLIVTFFRPATNPKGEPYRSPIRSYYFDLGMPREQALKEAKRMFVEDYSEGALAQAVDDFEFSIGPRPGG